MLLRRGALARCPLRLCHAHLAPLIRSLRPAAPAAPHTDAAMPKKGRPGNGRKIDTVHSSSHIQILGNGTDTGDTCPSVLLFFDKLRYVFNAGEGFQRYCFQHGVRLGRLSEIFLTRASTEAAGGLPGMLITMSEFGVPGLLTGRPGIALHGPEKLSALVEAIGSFVKVDGLRARQFGGGEGQPPLVKNDQVEIRPVVLMPEGPNGHERKAKRRRIVGGGDSDSNSGSDRGRRSASPARRSIGDRSSPSRSPSVAGEVPAACYVCTLADSPGKFHPERALALGVPKGPLFRVLQGGSSVVLGDGREVTPQEVMDPAQPGPVVLIVDCPTDGHLPPLLAARGLAGGEGRPVCVVHLTPHQVVEREAYQEWVAAFDEDLTSHVFVNLKASQSSAVMRKSTVVQTKLNNLDGTFFPLPSTAAPVTGAADGDLRGRNHHRGRNLMKWILKPQGKMGASSEEVLEGFSVEAVLADLERGHPAAVEAIKAYKESVAQLDGKEQTMKAIGREELEVTFLGTGSAVPSKYRNVTSIYLDFFGKGSILLDCGEGSYGQLVRRFGQDGASQALRKLRAVWISHIHADHHAGLPRILNARQRLLSDDAPPLLVIGTFLLRRVLQTYAKFEPMDFRYLLNDHTMGEGSRKARVAPEADAMELYNAAKKDLGLKAFESFAVKHCANAFGAKLVSTSGWKVVFSGDSRPCNETVEAAKDATLLIHEATFEDDLGDEAKAKKHSTTGEAVRVGAEAGAYRTILTHFSQRYPKVPVFDDSFQASTCVAFDLMSVNLADLERLPMTNTPLKMLFAEEAAADGDTQPDVEAVA
eukprot:evm.model.scf_112.2 EVM.evm.TU.scf_112.2   scf_112:6839-12772(+)